MLENTHAQKLILKISHKTERKNSMFAATVIRRRISTYALFMRDTAKSPALQGLSIPERARKLSKMYKALTPTQMDALRRRSYQNKAPKHCASRIARRKTLKLKSNTYAFFTKKMYKKVEGTPAERIKKIAEVWKSTH